MNNSISYNEYNTTTSLKVISIPNPEFIEYGFLEYESFWELEKKDFVLDYTISIRIYKETKVLSIEVSDFDEFYVIDITKILENKETVSKSQVENAKNIYNIIWLEICKLTTYLIINMDDFKYGDFFVKYD